MSDLITAKTVILFAGEAALTGPFNAAVRRIALHFAAKVVARAKASLVDAPGSSRPGEPPHSHTDELRDGIDYSFDGTTGELEIGPQRLDKSGDAPAVLELGGQTVITKRTRSGARRQKTVTIAARPFIQPAFNAELATLPDEWRGAIHN